MLLVVWQIGIPDASSSVQFIYSIRQNGCHTRAYFVIC